MLQFVDSSVFGLLTSLAAFFYGTALVVYTMVFGGVITGYASLMAGMLFLSGIQLTSIGIVGIYLSTVFKEVKARPAYIVGSVCGLEQDGPEKIRVPHESVY